jgi:hypothetical protein
VELGVRKLLIACLVVGVLPCRYTVRDLGFVDLSGPDYLLRLHADDESDRTPAADFEAESNLRFERVAATDGPRWSLVREGRPDLLLSGIETSLGDMGAAAALEHVLGSAVLTRISSDALDTFAFALIVEGSERGDNEALHDLVAEAEQRLDSVADQLPRRIDWPLRTIVVKAGDREQEAVLLWALGLDQEEFGPTDSAIALVYGRGKLAGPVLVGEELELREVLAQLVLIGESCECETNRAWADEPRLPLRWTDKQRAAASAALGFDPDSPMVKGEVARILARGPKDIVDRPRDSIEALLFGYQETDLGRDALAAARGGTPDAPASPVPERADDLRVVEAGEGDWGFADDGAVELTPAGPGQGEVPPSRPALKPSFSTLVLLGCAFALVLAVLGGIILLIRGREE